MEKQEILAIYGTEYKQMTKTLLQEADLEGRILSKECKIGIVKLWRELLNICRKEVFLIW